MSKVIRLMSFYLWSKRRSLGDVIFTSDNENGVICWLDFDLLFLSLDG
mgnify:CR=1 FL=1